VQPAPTFDDVLRAREILRGRIHETPVLRVPSLDDLSGAELYLKCENLQRIGAFKARGALYAVLSQPGSETAKGLVTFSSGNHGQAVALAAKELGVPAWVVMPTDAPAVKIDAVKGLGAEVTFAGTTTTDRKREAHAIAERTGAKVIPPFDDPRIIAGQATATLELLEAAERDGAPLDAVLVPVGGGGLLAGACIAAEGYSKRTRVIAVEPALAPAFSESFKRGERVEVTVGPTIADGLKPVQIGELNFDIARRLVADAVTVDETAIARAVAKLLFEAKILVEPSGATACAAAFERKVPGSPRRIGVLLSGGNVSRERLTQILNEVG
jgi:threonine dehydratase